MNVRLQVNFSHQFTGVIWNTIALPENNVLLIEVRDPEKKQVSFSAFNYKTQSFLWTDRKMEEPWWISLAMASQGVLLFNLYHEKATPDQKAVLAYGLDDLNLLWWKNDFSITEIRNKTVSGVSIKFGLKEEWIDLFTGKETTAGQKGSPTETKDFVLRPFHYAEGTSHFSSLKKFLSEKLNLPAIASFEYLEYNSLIFLSYYVQENGLVNYLLALDEDGNVLLKEKIGEQLKGIGLGTFFVLEGCLIFAKNNSELVGYKIF